MNNKNAYEIRLEILKMAHDDLTQVFYEKLSVLRDYDNRSYEIHRDLGRLGKWKAIATHDEINRLYPSSLDIINRAKELYDFVG